MNLQEYISANWDCNATYAIDLYLSGGISNNTSWNNQPGTVGGALGRDTIGGSGHTGCYNNVPFSYNVTPTFQQYAPTYPNLTFELFGVEWDANAFKRLTPQPTLDIQYDRVPNTPTNPHLTPYSPGTGVPNTRFESCNNSASNTWGWIGAGSGAPGTVSLNATVSSPIQNQLYSWSHIWDYNKSGTPDVASGYSQPTNNGGNAYLTLGGGVILDGHAYGYSIMASDQLPGVPWSGATATCHFRVDMTPPTLTLPTTVSDPNTQFPPSGNGQATTLTAGKQGYLPYTAVDNPPAPGLNASGVVAVYWGFDPNLTGSGVNVAYAPNLPSQLPITPTHWGTNIAYIQVEDNAGNKSQITPYSFYVPWSPTPSPTATSPATESPTSSPPTQPPATFSTTAKPSPSPHPPPSPPSATHSPHRASQPPPPRHPSTASAAPGTTSVPATAE